MAAFMKIDGIKGEATETKHKDWIIIQSLDSSIHRTIPAGAKDSQRSRGETALGDISVVRELDKSSPKLAEACATGLYYKEVQIDFTTDVNNKPEVYLTYTLKNVIVSGYSFHGVSSGDPLPTEDVSLSFTDIEWKYVEFDNNKGMPKGNVVGKYNPGKGTA